MCFGLVFGLVAVLGPLDYWARVCTAFHGSSARLHHITHGVGWPPSYIKLLGNLIRDETPFPTTAAPPRPQRASRDRIEGGSGNAALTRALLEHGERIPRAELFPVLVPEAAELIAADPYAFLIATCLDRGTRAEVVWTIPYDLKRRLGHLNPRRVATLSTETLAGLLQDLPREPRYINDAPRTVQELTAMICQRFDGKAARLWEGRKASDVRADLRRIHGVGPGIASMAVQLIEKVFGVRFADNERPTFDIKPDTHTMRVLYRLGVAESIDPAAAIEASRRLLPSCPGELDATLWHVGRTWCLANNPTCDTCPMAEVCPKVGLFTASPPP
jgi:endonuclease III